ncbi:C40 family peptidase [Pontibacter ramchanderi]|uniref:Cell wall-associated NlpC family hydrolase n=1 Tax=Pontibacter ramchanderi TaxID=1179743 RepID=A0A2N3V2E2_9BACT|nr:C40 family peptidase [Pontibacter ramchanderi]PKV75763.1 cell wall-associated NlpC family hydrolase [Pontibacter ramchanderi]
MKKIFALMLTPVVLLFVFMTAGNDQPDSASMENAPVQFASMHSANEAPKMQAANTNKLSRTAVADTRWVRANDSEATESLIAYALTLMGTPYQYGGTTSNGFDCSGFTSHVFQEFGVPVTRSSATQAADGVSVERDEARPGDLVIFTGTNPQVREPGHVGIVISEPGDTISFVHSSSNGGVKISQVEGTGYETRFLDIRRVL